MKKKKSNFEITMAMTRKTLIFGNGLGMALDPEFFSIDKAIGKIWDGEALDQVSKDLICQCLPGEEPDRPHGEDDIDVLQLALSACDFLNIVSYGKTHWLTDDGQGFPLTVRKLFYSVAMSFHGFQGALPAGFTDSLVKFLLQTKSHVATLNYDNLLYQPLIERKVLRGYSGALVDGFHGTGFQPDNLERKFERTFGYYLHLHGSPLFIDRNGQTLKLQQRELVEGDTVSSHIVLTHVDHKPTVISASHLLVAYWQYLLQAFSESEEIILVGYSGADKHLNTLLLRSARDIPIRIVEWNEAGNEAERMQFWGESLKREITLIQLHSIFEFEEWSAEPNGDR